MEWIRNTCGQSNTGRPPTIGAAQESMAERILRMSPVGITLVDANAEVRYANERAKSILGFSDAEERTRRFDSPAWKITDVDGNPFPAERLPFNIVRTTLRPVVGVTHAITFADGSRRVLSINGEPEIGPDGEFLGGVFAIVDVTEALAIERETAELGRDLDRKARERTSELESAVHELEAFAYSVSHDMRAPLRYVTGFVQMLREHLGDSLDEEGERILHTVIDSAAEMSELIDRLLAYSRGGRAEMNREHVDLSDLVTRVREMVDPEDSRIEWQIAELPPVRGDRQLLMQVMTNLLSNAVKFSRNEEHPRIHVSAEPGESGFVDVNVCDNGVGFNMEHAHRLFEVFHRMHRSNEFEGHGVGLASARRIVERHGGTIKASAEPGNGAVFTASLPVDRPEEQE